MKGTLVVNDKLCVYPLPPFHVVTCFSITLTAVSALFFLLPLSCFPLIPTLSQSFPPNLSLILFFLFRHCHLSAFIPVTVSSLSLCVCVLCVRVPHAPRLLWLHFKEQCLLRLSCCSAQLYKVMRTITLKSLRCQPLKLLRRLFLSLICGL